MIRISALNDSSDDESQSVSRSRPSTKEAQESAAVALYNQALTLLRQSDDHGAEATFRKLLDAPFVRDAEPPEGGEVLVEPGVVLKYSTYKNLGSMAAQKEDYTTAMRHYLEAVMVDSSDVTVWYKIGTIALKLHQYPLARHAFEQGLECQPRHWPCIDNVITVLYALNNYEACLVYISRALQRDPGYIKGISFMEKLFEEQPSLRRHMGCYFEACDNSIFTVEVDQDEADEFVNEALDMRAKKEALCRRADRPVLNFTRPLTAFSWLNLANCLIALYDHIASSKPPITYSCKVDLSKYTSQEELEAQQQAQPQPQQPPQLPQPQPQQSPQQPPQQAQQQPQQSPQQSPQQPPQQAQQQPQQSPQQPPQQPPHQAQQQPQQSPQQPPQQTQQPPQQAQQPPQQPPQQPQQSQQQPQEPSQPTPSGTLDQGTTTTDTPVSQTQSDQPMDTSASGAPVSETPATDTSVAVAASSQAVVADIDMADRSMVAQPAAPSGETEKDGKEEGDVSAMDTTVNSDVSMLADTSLMREPGKRGPKRKRFIANTEKRRSSRVRNTGSTCKQIEDEVKIRDLVGSILPTSLTQVRDEEAEAEFSQEGDPAGSGEDKGETAASGSDQAGVPADCQLLSATEKDDVLAFIKSHQINSGIIDLLNELLIALAQRALCIWPEGLATSYTKAYSRLHKHIIMPGYLCKDVPDERIVNMGKMILVYSELKVDRWIGTRSRATPSPRRSGTNPLGPNFAGDTFYSDMAYIDGLSQCQDIFLDEWAQFNIRVFWMKAKFNMLDSDMQEAITSFDRTSMYLEYVEKEEGKPADLYLPHLTHDKKITLENVKQQIESLHRCQSQDKMQTLHDSGEYEKVIQLLLETFTADPNGPKVLEIERQERHAQLLLLMESLLKVSDFKRAMIWGEVCFDEALLKYYSVLTDSGQNEWATTMTQILDTLDKCIKEDSLVISQLTSRCLVRLTQNLTSLIETAFDVAENASDMAIPTMLPWILLYRLVHHEEERVARPLGEPTDEDSGPSGFVPRHEGAVSMLELVHEQLGRRSWCCNHDGSLLLFIVSEVLREARAAESAGAVHPQHSSLDHMLEQCFYCLYGHPNRRKAKHLHDHSSSQIPLTWERAVDVFEFFKPKSIPEYDSLKTSTVSGELESLLRRIYIMVPTDLKLPLTVEGINLYIEGTTSTPPPTSDDDQQEMRVVSELYYLLADYYFKNKEQGKAIKFYLQDLCVNPERFDSWAGMALARASRLEQKLSMSELKSEGKNEGSIWKHAIASLRSFQRALDLDSSNSKLWIEYGSLAYQLHAHASRQLKQYVVCVSSCYSPPVALQLKGEGVLYKQPMYPLTEHALEEATSNRTEMLTIAGNCYRKAGECEVDENEEEWLHHYMLGKVAEKKGADPEEYLKHYKQALQYLHNDRARYPKKITYIYSPPHLAVETLEVFYRLHASIIKYLVKHPTDSPFVMFDQYVQEAADGPFANAQEKEKKPKERDGLADEGSNSNLTSPIASMANASLTSTPTPSSSGRPKKSNVTRIDHSYSKQRSIDSGRSDADSSNEASKAQAATAKQGGTALASDSLDSMQSPIAFVTSVTSANNTPVSATSSTASADEVKFATPMTSFSMANILQSGSSPVSVSSSSKETITVTSSAGEEKGKDSNAVSPDTTCLDESDLLSAPPVTDSAITPAVGQQPSTSVELLSPQASQSLSQDSSQFRETDQAKPEPMDVSVDNSLVEFEVTESQVEGAIQKQTEALEEEQKRNIENSAPASEPDVKPVEAMDYVQEVKVQDLADQNKPAELGASEDKIVIKTETDDAPSQMSVPEISLGPTGTDSSSQDSTTAAELEKLKSEISFLNAGSSEMTAISIMDTSDHESVKDEKDKEGERSMPVDVKVEAEEENKEDEEMSSQNEALEALKSELAELSAAAGSQITADYESPDIKIDDKSQDGSQGFSMCESKTEVKEEKDKSQDQTTEETETPEDSTKKTTEAEEATMKEQEQKEEPIATASSSFDPSIETGINVKDESGSESSKGKEASSFKSGDEEKKEKLEESVEKISEEKEPEQDDTKRTEQGSEQERKHVSSAEGKDVPMPLAKETTSTEQESDEKKVEGTTQKTDAAEKPEPKTDGQRNEDSQKAEDKGNEIGANDKTSKETGVDGDKSKIQESGKEKEEAKGTEKAQKDGETEVPGKPEKEVDAKEMFRKILTQCIKALNLCLSRFPHHYKSLFRLSHIYYHCEEFKNHENARDMLLGNLNWQQLDHMPSPGLFQDRKSTNFFQGLWRIPIEEIDRSGSFACHMLRSLQLLFPILKSLKDSKTLFSIHTMLSRTPDQGKKYLRDSDRLELARLALEYAVTILEGLVEERAAGTDREVKVAYLLEIYKVLQYGLKAHQFSHNLNKLLRKAYSLCMKDQIEAEPSVLEQAVRFCQQEQQKAVRSPTTPDGSRSLPSTPTLHRANPLEGFSVPTKAAPTQADSLKPPGESSGTKPISIKGISPLPTRGASPINPTSLNKVVKPCSVRLTSPYPGKSTSNAIPGGKSSVTISPLQKLRKTLEGSARKLTMSNVLKKPDPKKSLASSAASTPGGQKLPKKMTPVTTVSSPYSIFQGTGAAAMAGMNTSQYAAMYAQMAQMAPETLMAQYGAALNQEAVLAQMALASSYGIPMAAMPYMFTGATLDPSLWSSLAAAQAFSESQSSTKTTPPPRQSSTVKSSAAGSVAAASSTSQQQKSGQKLQRAAPTTGTSEPPKKITKMTPIPWSETKKVATAPAAHSSTSAGQPLSLTTKTTVSASTSSIPARYELEPGEIVRPRPAHSHIPPQPTGPIKTSPGLKVSAKTSQLYAVRMTSALAKISQAKAPQAPTVYRSPDAPPPAKIVKRTEAPTTLSTANFDPLNMLATAAQTHKQSQQIPKATSSTAPKVVSSQQSTPSPAALARMIKGPPTLKGRKARSYQKQPVSSQVKSAPPQAHSSHRPPAMAHSQPMNLSSQSEKRPPVASPKPPTAGTTKTNQPVGSSLLAQHLTSRESSSTSTVSSTPRMSTALARPTMAVSRPAVPTVSSTPRMSTTLARPSMAVSRPAVSPIRPSMVMQQQMKTAARPLPVPQPSKSGMVRPSLVSTTQGLSSAQAGAARSITPQQIHQGYGRGKPSYPATLAARQEDDSSNDCIIISSGQESESD